ncbi:hypothetical protein PV327_003251 [Microctonus hyperodae]|uniref:Uncharacterized protein n=1 Tax=Microctonus hyperodae TaxID=165561 RepID=A0AA39G446_MICHY|nr:hypothetical protein PV327_003251 [Microctonus hyperodae]
MNKIIVLIILLVWVDFTVQRAKIGRLCPEADKLKSLFGHRCIKITCKSQRILKSNFTINMDRNLDGLHPRYHKVEKCNWGCKSGQFAKPVEPKVTKLLYPRCCQSHICMNSLDTLKSLASTDEWILNIETLKYL